MTAAESTSPPAPRWQEYMTLGDLLQRRDPRNAKGHDEDRIAESMDRFGYIEPITLDERTGLLVSGHGRVTVLARERDKGDDAPEGIVTNDDGEWLVPVNRGWASADDDEAELALATANRLVETGGWDLRRLHEQLTRQNDRPAGLRGTGFDTDELRRMQRQLDVMTPPPTGAADETPQLHTHYSIMIECENEQQQTALLQRFLSEGLTCRALLL